MFNSMRFRLMLIFVGLAVGPSILVGAIIGQRSFASLEQQSQTLQREVATRVGCEIRAFIGMRENELVLLDRVHGLGILELEAQRTMLGNLLLYQRVYQEIVLLDSEGQEQIRLSRSSVILDDDLKNRAKDEEFLFPATRGGTYFGPVRFDETIREPLLTISVPLYDQRSGRVVSVLAADLRFKTMWDLLANVELSNEREVYVIDRAGQVVAHRNPAIVLRGTTVDLAEANGRAEGLSGTDVIIARDILQFGNQELVVVAEQPISKALELATNSLRVTVAITFVALVFAVVLVMLAIRRVVRPIEALAVSARAISSGDFSLQVKVSSWGEVRELARAFNSMSRQLQQLLAGLEREIANRRQAQETLKEYSERLEEMVEQRTQELQEAQAELVRQERLSALGQLTSTVAHEIRNPLGTVYTSIFVIGDTIERDETFMSLGRTRGRVERALQLAERNIVRCDNIISELLAYTRDRVLQLKPMPIDAWLEGVLDGQTIPQGIVCTRELKAGVEVPIDDEHLYRAVTNVVGNAIDALQDEAAVGNQLTVSTHVVGNRLEIRVSDTGCGIPPDVLPKIFEPLFSTKTFGVGLGLPIVKDIMEQHGGGVEIKSKVGRTADGLADCEQFRGTMVTLWLPRPDEGGD